MAGGDPDQYRHAPPVAAAIRASRSGDTLHWRLGGDVIPPDLDMALQSDEESLARERERLWFVACTRAKELLIVPEIPAAGQKSWARIVDLDHDLPEPDLSGFIDLSGLSYAPAQLVANRPNRQTADRFERERSVIREAATPLTWAEAQRSRSI
jgi:ATP-dependent exoDNAse (exonuclease V) beta subunit